MPYPLGAVSVQGGKTYPVPVGSTGTVGAVVIANESPYSLSVSANSSGTGGQWIVAQTVDIVYCDTGAFNGALTIITDNYLTNSSSAPSFLVYLTAYAPGEPIRGTYPAPLMRLANGLIGVANQLVNDSSAAGSLIVETRPSGQTQSFIALYNDGQADWWVLRSDGVAQEVLKIINQAGVKSGQLLFPGGWFSGGSASIQDDGLGNLTATGKITAGAPLTLAVGNQETGYVTAYFQAAAGNAFGGSSANFKTVLTNTPTSITLSALSTQNFSTVGTETLSKYGFSLYINSTAAGITKWEGTYTTVGNCLLAVDTTARTIDHHCDACGHVSTAEPFAALQLVPAPIGPALAYVCPVCGSSEHFNVALSAADEADTSPQGSGQYATTRGAQASLIRQLMTALGLEVMS